MVDAVILTAIGSEFSAVAEALHAVAPSSGRFPWLPTSPVFRTRVARRGGRTVAIAQSGVGLQRACSATQWLLEHLDPKCVFVLGVAGGLTPELRVGDVVIADSIVSQRGGDRVSLVSAESQWLDRLPRDLNVRVATAPIASSEEILLLPSAKRALRDATGAAAVDMESLAVVRVCRNAHVPVQVVRAISDDLDERLPTEIGELLDPAGNPRFLHAAWRILRRPNLFRELRSLARNSAAACRTLKIVAAALFPLSPGLD